MDNWERRFVASQVRLGTLTLTDAWFLESREVRQHGRHDPRPTSRMFRVTFGDGKWQMLREDPDFHQRFVATVTADRIEGQWDASEDEGATWRKDFKLIFERERSS